MKHTETTVLDAIATYVGTLTVRNTPVRFVSSRHTITDHWLLVRSEFIRLVIEVDSDYTEVEGGLSDVRREEGKNRRIV